MLPRSGEMLLCLDCGGPSGFAVSPAMLELLRRIGRESLPVVAERAPSPALLRQIEDLCAQVRRHFLQHELRSYDVIQRTLAKV